MTAPERSVIDDVVDVYRLVRVELARADLGERDEVLLLDGAAVLETVLRAEGIDPRCVPMTSVRAGW